MDGVYLPVPDDTTPTWSNTVYYVRFLEPKEEMDLLAGWVVQDATGTAVAFMPQLIRSLPATGLWRVGRAPVSDAARLPGTLLYVICHCFSSSCTCKF